MIERWALTGLVVIIVILVLGLTAEDVVTGFFGWRRRRLRKKNPNKACRRGVDWYS